MFISTRILLELVQAAAALHGHSGAHVKLPDDVRPIIIVEGFRPGSSFAQICGEIATVGEAPSRAGLGHPVRALLNGEGIYLLGTEGLDNPERSLLSATAEGKLACASSSRGPQGLALEPVFLFQADSFQWVEPQEFPSSADDSAPSF